WDLRAGRARPGGVLGRLGARARVVRAVAYGAGVGASARALVRGGEAERGLQLPGSPPRRRASQQGGADLGGGAGGSASLHLLGPLPRGVQVRQRAALPRGGEGGP